MQLSDMRWILCNSTCLVYEKLILLFSCMIMRSDLLIYFIMLVLEYDIEELRSIVSIYDWRSHLVQKFYLMIIYR